MTVLKAVAHHCSGLFTVRIYSENKEQETMKNEMWNIHQNLREREINFLNSERRKRLFILKKWISRECELIADIDGKINTAWDVSVNSTTSCITFLSAVTSNHSTYIAFTWKFRLIIQELRVTMLDALFHLVIESTTTWLRGAYENLRVILVKIFRRDYHGLSWII